MPLPWVDVAVAILTRPDGSVLLAERTARQTGAGLWELPGGKIEAGESAAEAAARELEEEVGVRAQSLRAAVSYTHAYRTRRLRLQFFHVLAWTGVPLGREGQRIAWVDPAMPAVGPIQPSNARILRALGLPGLYFDCRCGSAGDASAQLAAVASALAAGGRLLRIGGPALSADQRVQLARRAVLLAEACKAEILLDGTATEACRAGVAGVHVCTQALRRAPVRPPVELWLATCHDAADLALAVAAGVDAVALAPVGPPVGGSRRPALGWPSLAELARRSPVPVYAQGGLQAEDRAIARAHGAVGVACPAPLPVRDMPRFDRRVYA